MRASNAWSPAGNRRMPDRWRLSSGVDAAATAASRVSATSVRACDTGRCTLSGRLAQPVSSPTSATTSAQPAQVTLAWARPSAIRRKPTHWAISMGKRLKRVVMRGSVGVCGGCDRIALAVQLL